MSAAPGIGFERQFTNELESLNGVTEAAIQFIEEQGVDAGVANLARLVIEEVATNVLKYAYDDTAAHGIWLRLHLEPGALSVVIEDDGRAFNPLEAAPPDLDLPLEQREPGGLGIHLVRQLARRIEYQRCEGRNRLTVQIAT